jgi:hypothetical protein
MDADAIAKYINQYGFPIIAAGGMGYIVYFVWLWATTVVTQKLTTILLLREKK